MARYLVVCDQTLESHKLLAHMQQLENTGPCSYHILSPASHPDRTWTWTEHADEVRAQERLDNALERFRARGLEVSGEVGEPNPVSAINDVLLREPDTFVGVVVCTPPLGARRLGQDLVQRIERAVPLPVSHVVASATRPYGGGEIPEAGTYEIDPAHSSVEFVARFLTITKIRGRFTDFSGLLRIADVPVESSVSITIDAESVTTDNPKRDAHLRSPDFLDVERYPTVMFASTRIESLTDEIWKVAGDLTLHGVTQPVGLDVDFDGIVLTPAGEQRAGFSASTDIDRDEWGVSWNQALETGGLLVGKRLSIELVVQAVRVG